MFKRTALAVVALGAISLATQTHVFTLTSPTAFQKVVVVPGYDTADGPLRAVTICMRYKHMRFVEGESTDAEPTTVAFAFSEGLLSLSKDGTSLAEVVLPGHADAMPVTEFDGAMDYSGTSSFTWRESREGLVVVTLEDQALLDQFSGVPTVSLDAVGFDQFGASGAGNLEAESSTEIAVYAEVIYN